MKFNLKKFALIVLAGVLFPLLTVSAYTPKEFSQYAKEISEAQKWQLEGQVELTKQAIKTVYNGSLSTPTLWNNHTVQWLTVGSESAVKPVVWSVGTGEGFKATNLDKTVKDYEAKHPGYIVVGAINGDFFDNSSGGTGEPTNFHVQEGDVLRAAAPGASYRGVLGFGETNKDHVAVFGQQRDAKMSLEVLENNKTVQTFTVEGTNVNPSTSGVTVYTKRLSSTVDLTGYTVYEGSYIEYRDYSGGYFLKGSIKGVANVSSLSSVDGGKFYVATKEANLAAGQAVKVEYNLAGELAGINNAVGFIYQVLKDGKPQYANTTSSNNDNALFINTTHPRTLVGFKKDGSVVLMVIDGRGGVSENLEGASLFQCGELLRIAGCVEGYNLDGGGSSTLMARINGQLTLINDPSDARQTGAPWGTLRSTGNAVLLVMKDPKIKVEQAVGNTITVRRTGEVVNGTLQNVKVKVGPKTYDLVDDELTITGLTPDYEYSVTYTYEILNDDGTIEGGKSSAYKVKTEDYKFPILKTFEEYKKEEGTVVFKYNVTDESEVISKLYVKNGNNETVLEGLSGKVTIENIDTTVANEYVLMAELTNGRVVEFDSISYEAGDIPPVEEPTDPVPPVEEPDDPKDPVEDPNKPSDPVGDPEQPVQPSTPSEPEKKGCKKDLTLLVVSLIGLSSLLIFVKKKR